MPTARNACLQSRYKTLELRQARVHLTGPTYAVSYTSSRGEMRAKEDAECQGIDACFAKFVEREPEPSFHQQFRPGVHTFPPAFFSG